MTRSSGSSGGISLVLSLLLLVVAAESLSNSAPPSWAVTYSEEVRCGVEAVAEASRLAKELQAALCGTSGVSKDDASPVTLADVAAQAIVIAQLSKRFPDDAFIAEESASALMAAGPSGIAAVTKAAEATGMDLEELRCFVDLGKRRPVDPKARVWTLDPIDGTKGFLRGDQFCCALSLLDFTGEKREPVLGVLGCPNLTADCALDNNAGGVVVAALRGAGAWRRPLDDGEWTRMRVSTQRPWQNVEGVATGHSDHIRTAELAKRLGMEGGPLRLDSQAKAAVLAVGGAQMMTRLPQRGYIEKVWDHAAQFVVVTEAGGCFTDELGEPIDFDLGEDLDAKVTGILATSSPNLHDEVVTALAKIPISHPY